MSNRPRARGGLTTKQLWIYKRVRCPECGGKFGQPFRRPDGRIDAVVDHLDGCRTINVFIDMEEPK